MAKWTYQDDLIACKFYLKNKNKSIARIEHLDLALNHKFSISSLKAKIGNYAYLATGKGLANCNFQSKYIYRLLTSKKSVKYLSSAAKGKQTADVANAAIRNILTLLSQYKGYVTTADVFAGSAYFHNRCPYTGENLTTAIENRKKGIKDSSIELDHIVPQNDKYCGLNVNGNLVWVKASVNRDKGDQNYEEFIQNDPQILATTTQKERDDRIAEIRKYQALCGYDPESIQKTVSAMLQQKYKDIQMEQLDFAAKLVKKAKL